MTKYEPRRAVLSGGDEKGNVVIPDDAIIVDSSVEQTIESYEVTVTWLHPVADFDPPA